MRIVSGSLKGRRFEPSNLSVRPTTDFAKEGIFNVLNNLVDFEICNALDLFAGTGNISLELISRGCSSVVSVDNNAKFIAYINKNQQALTIENLTALNTDVFKFLVFNQKKYDLIFADPPYDIGEDKYKLLYSLVFEHHHLNHEAYFIIEHPREIHLQHLQYFNQQRHYGKVNFTIFKYEEQ